MKRETSETMMETDGDDTAQEQTDTYKVREQEGDRL